MDEKRTIRLAGEQAEVFDNQMDADKALMEATDDCVAFRPQIEGEWNEFAVIGSRPQALLVYDSASNELIDQPCNWTCVIDVFKAVNALAEPSGCRTRLPCPEPTMAIRGKLREAAISYAKTLVAIWGEQSKANRLKNMRSSPGEGFGPIK
jgi:hypothetical protein